MSEVRRFEKQAHPNPAVAKDRILSADLTDVGEMLDVYKIPQNIKHDPEVIAAIRETIRNAEERIQEWKKEGVNISEESLDLPNKIRQEFGIEE